MNSKWHSKTWIIAFSTLSKLHFGVGQEAENDLAVPCNYRKSRFFNSPKSHFRLVQNPKISWKSHVIPWNIDFSISTISRFPMVRRSKMSSKCHGNLLNIAFSTSPSWNFGFFKRNKMTFKCNSPLELSHYRHDKIPIFGLSRSK